MGRCTRSSVVGVIVLVLGFSACDTRLPVSLASIRTVGPATIETDDVLQIAGEGFVEGPVQVTFDGTLKPSGLKPPRPIRIALAGHCANQELVEVEMNALNLAELTDETAVFAGAITVVFPTPLRNTAIRISAQKSDVHLALRPGGGGLAMQATDDREGRRALALLGLSVSSDDQGVAVQQVIAGTIAARAAVPVGARLVAVDGISIETPADLAGMNLESVHAFEFIRPDGTALRLQTDVSSFSLMPLDEFLSVVLASLALAVFFSFALHKPPVAQKSEERPRTAGVSVIAYCLAALPAMLVPVLAPQPRMSFALTILLLSSTIGAMVLAAVYSRASAASRFFGLLAHMTAPVAVLVIGVLFSEAAGIAEAVDVQGRVFFGWQVFDNPFAMLTGLLAIGLLWPVKLQSPESPRGIEAVSCWIAATAGACLCAAFLFGGWPQIDTGQVPQALKTVLPPLVFAGKALLLLLIARFLSRTGRGDRRRQRRADMGPYLRAVLLVLSAAGAVGWKYAPLPLSVRLIGTAMALGGVCLAGFRLALIMVRRFRA